LLQRPEIASQLGEALASQIPPGSVDLAIAPALGGILVAHEAARALGVRALFAERDPASRELTLRRGFLIAPGERALVLEDVVTTGGSLRETMEVVRSHQGSITATGALVDRSKDHLADLGLPFYTLARLDFPTYEASSCPLCQSGTQAIKPGSRPS
jgi:orotate phosphoribosyltransferase